MKLFFVTSNPHKIKAARKYLEKSLEIQSISFDLPEIQGTSRDVAIRKAKDAYKKIGKPLFIVDSSFKIKALNDFPDAYASYVEHTLKDTGILKLMEGETDRRASYVDTLVYIDKYGYQVFISETKGLISDTSFEGSGEPFDKIFIRNKDQFPIAYYDNLGDTIYQNKTYLKLKEFFQKRKVARGITFFDDKVLLLHRKRTEGKERLEYYSIPGGGLENSETPEDAVIREMEEETSIKIKINAYLDFEEYDTGVCYYFYTEYQSGEIALSGEEKEKNNPDNFYEIALVPVNELTNLKMYGLGISMIEKAYKIYQNK